MKTPPSNKKNYLLAAVLALIIGALSLGGYLWNSQVKELKNNRTLQEQRIQELENKLNDKKGAINDDGSPNWADNPLYTPTNKDVDGINKLLKELCPAPNKVTPIDLEWLQFSGSDEKDATYYNGYARVNVICNEPGEESAGGYYAILKKQSDGTWQKILSGQDVAECTEVNKLKIPHQIYRSCLSGTEVVSNTN